MKRLAQAGTLRSRACTWVRRVPLATLFEMSLAVLYQGSR